MQQKKNRLCFKGVNTIKILHQIEEENSKKKIRRKFEKKIREENSEKKIRRRRGNNSLFLLFIFSSLKAKIFVILFFIFSYPLKRTMRGIHIFKRKKKVQPSHLG